MPDLIVRRFGSAEIGVGQDGRSLFELALLGGSGGAVFRCGHVNVESGDFAQYWWGD